MLNKKFLQTFIVITTLCCITGRVEAQGRARDSHGVGGPASSVSFAACYQSCQQEGHSNDWCSSICSAQCIAACAAGPSSSPYNVCASNCYTKGGKGGVVRRCLDLCAYVCLNNGC